MNLLTMAALTILMSSIVNCSGAAYEQVSGVVDAASIEAGSISANGTSTGVSTGAATDSGASTSYAIAAGDKYKCAFQLRGANGAVWNTERYTLAADCSAEQNIVAANNPNAQILGIVRNYVHDLVASADKTKCTYRLRGPNGGTWFSERYIAANGDCNGAERDIVRLNNPNATLTSVVGNYVHDDVAGASKYKCGFNLRGANGFTWFVERYTAQSSCANEAAAVRANNPNATASAQAIIFVYDKY